MNRHVVEFRVIDGKQIKAKEVMQDQIALVGSQEVYKMMNQHLANLENEVDLDYEIFRLRQIFLLANVHENGTNGTNRHFGFLVTQCFDQFIIDLESSACDSGD